MESIKNFFAGIGMIGLFLGFIAFGLLQIAAMITGFEEWFGYDWGWFGNTVVAMVLIFLLQAMPLLGIPGAILGCWAAITVWHWSPWIAVPLFGFPVIFFGMYLIFGGALSIATLLHRRRQM